MVDIAAIANFLPPWVLIVIAAVVGAKYLGQSLAEGSEQWARVFGPLGRRWRGRAARRADQEARRVEQEAADLRNLKRQVGNLVKEVDRLTRRDQQRGINESRLRDYLVYDADWHWRARMSAVESGANLPEHLSFTQWEAIPHDSPPDDD